MKQAFPVKIKNGSVSVTIYFSPVITDEKQYDSFVVTYHSEGKPIRLRCSDYKKAREEANAIAAKLSNGEMLALKLSGADRLLYVTALDNLKPTGAALDMATKEYAGAVKILKGASLMDAARFFMLHSGGNVQKATVGEVVEQLIKNLTRANRSEYYLRDMRQRLNDFASAFPKMIGNITTEEIDEWLEGIKVASRTRNHYRNSIVSLFRFAKKRGFLVKSVPTAADGSTLSNVVCADIQIMTVDDMATVLHQAPSWMAPSLAIKAFSGVRTEELMRMEWKNVNFKTGYITLESAITKTASRRQVPLFDNLRAWLLPHQGKSGRICDRWTRPQALYQAWDRLASKQEIHVGANKLRHSYISYRIAETNDVPKVAYESGNSPRVIQTDYLQLVTAEDAKQWFEIMPVAKNSTQKRRRKACLARLHDA